MDRSKTFSGPPANKVTASTFAVGLSTLFWTIAAHTFWKGVSAEDLSLYIATTTTIVTAIVGFLVPESAAFAEHALERLQPSSSTTDPVSDATHAQDLRERLASLERSVQDLERSLPMRAPSLV